eukprot:TRINITY_DN1363_c6_g1_i1.p1 TRINITY_DN1363_c6_g1~~TRINITY_DN1363_c6_g1_i1.p1  ORF type:complete len:142 (-),score=18.67 TRINITY_DN1363_c6_g1_i1:848-1273(-)
MNNQVILIFYFLSLLHFMQETEMKKLREKEGRSKVLYEIYCFFFFFLSLLIKRKPCCCCDTKKEEKWSGRGSKRDYRTLPELRLKKNKKKGRMRGGVKQNIKEQLRLIPVYLGRVEQHVEKVPASLGERERMRVCVCVMCI